MWALAYIQEKSSPKTSDIGAGAKFPKKKEDDGASSTRGG
jgi:hypothetical protein